MKNTIKVICFGIVLILCCGISFGQNKPADLSKFGRIGLGFHGVEFSYEFPVNQSLVWDNTIGLGLGGNIGSNRTELTWDFLSPNPYLRSEMKFMYNGKRRREKGRKMLLNAGSYLGLQLKYLFGRTENNNYNNLLLSELHWGLQRAIGRKFTFNFHVGIGYWNDFDSGYNSVTPSLGLKFGYQIVK